MVFLTIGVSREGAKFSKDVKALRLGVKPWKYG
jgi:hypothetical protein